MTEILAVLQENENYAISNYGFIYFIKNGRKRKLNTNDRCEVKLSLGKCKYQTFSVPHLVAKYFIPNDEGLTFVVRRDGDRFNNRVDNLYWSKSRYRKIVKVTKRDGTTMSFDSMKEAAAYFGAKLQTLSTCVSRNGMYKKNKIERIKA